MTSAPNSENIRTRSATARPRSPPLGSSWTAIITNPSDGPQPQRTLYPGAYPAAPGQESTADPGAKPNHQLRHDRAGVTSHVVLGDDVARVTAAQS